MGQHSPRWPLPVDRLELDCGELKPAYTEAEAVAEANRCLFCVNAPCINACPTHIDIPQFIRKIATGNIRGAARTIMAANILGFSCARVCPVEVLCVGDCVYNDWGRPPIQIGRLQRFPTDWALSGGVRFFTRGPETGRRVALIGAGPASLACAHELSRRGHSCVIFEGRTLPGGLNTTGVAPYKLMTEDCFAEVEYVLGIGGIELRTAVWIGKDIGPGELEREFDAVFIGVGLGNDTRLAVQGSDLDGCVGAVELIERLKNQPRHSLGRIRTAVIVGGGNTAIDVVREMKKLGAERSIMVYRRSEREMPAYLHEYQYARKEGCEFHFLALPSRIEGEGRVRRVLCQRMTLGPPDASGRQSPVPVEGSEFVIEADLVVEAIGQEKLTKFFAMIPGLVVERGRVKVDPATGQTANPRYFAGGDCVNGGKEVVNAVEEGKVAAAGIHAYIAARKS